VTVFPYGQYINGIVIYSSFYDIFLIQDWSWHLQDIC